MNESPLDQRIAAATTRIAGLELVRVVQSGGQVSAVFEIAPNPTYFKYFSTRWYTDPLDLLGTVLDTLEHLQVDKEKIDMNIFSAEMFEYLCAEMLPSNGRTVTLTIRDAEQDKISGPRGEQIKVILSFVERPKKLILNKTNARELARTLGNETDNWRGAAIVLGVEPVKVGKNTVPSIRVKGATPAKPRGGSPAQQPPPPTYADGSSVGTAALDGYRAYLAANDNHPPADVRALIAWQQGDSQQDDFFGDGDPAVKIAALATAQGQLD